MMKNKLTTLEAKNRTSRFTKLIEDNYLFLFRGTAVQGGGKKSEKYFKEAQELMSKIFAKATSNDPAKKSATLFSGSGDY